MTAVLPPRTAVYQPDPICWQREVAAAHHRGYRQAVHDIATRAVQLDHLDGHLWQAARLDAAQRLAARLAQMEAACTRLAQQMGRPAGWNYRGGTVDWNTGLPEGSACAWLRRRRSVTATPRRDAA